MTDERIKELAAIMVPSFSITTSHDTPKEWINSEVNRLEKERQAALKICSDFLREVIREAVAEQRKADADWQPIATAPKDGTPVIVALIRRGRIWRVSDAYWNDLAWYTIEGGKGVSWATHWIPLPPVPEEPSP